MIFHADCFLINQILFWGKTKKQYFKCCLLKILPSMLSIKCIIYDSAHDKTYNKTCAISEDSDQTAHPRSLIRVFADHMCILEPTGYLKRNVRDYLPYWVDVQADLNLCWSHRSYCRSCRALAHIHVLSYKKMLIHVHRPKLP